jgi:GntR family transcriptional regulator, transcriptional repressor for pyruvate dehydrogenase complex
MTSKELFRRVGKKRLSEEVARQIERAILDGDLRPGQLLPPERELAASFSVSRPILREAMRMLEIGGYISIEQGRGTFIKDPITDILHAPLLQWLSKNIHQVEEFYEARLAIEPVCAALASERASDRQISQLRILVNEAGKMLVENNLASYVSLDIDFHSEIARMADNSYLYKMLNSLISPEVDIRKVILRLPEHMKAAQIGHERVLEGIEERNPDNARAAMTAALNQPLYEIKIYQANQEET